MTTSASSLFTRRISSLAAGSPGTMARSPDSAGAKARSRRSSRKSASRCSGSGPWHLKQWRVKIGRMSRANSTSAVPCRRRERETNEQRDKPANHRRADAGTKWHGFYCSSAAEHYHAGRSGNPALRERDLRAIVALC